MQEEHHEFECIVKLQNQISNIQASLDKIIDYQTRKSLNDNPEYYIKNIVSAVINELSSPSKNDCTSFEDLLSYNAKMTIKSKIKGRHL